jgi:hypothetical protein
MRAIVLSKVERAAELLSPADDLGATESELREQWRGHYDELNRTAAEQTA